MTVRNTLNCFSRWSSPSVRSVLWSSSGYDGRIISWSESSGEIRCCRSTTNSYAISSRRSASPWRATGKSVARIRATIWEFVRRSEVIQNMIRSRFEICRNWTLLLCSSATKRKRKWIFMSRIYDASRSRRNSYQRLDPKDKFVREVMSIQEEEKTSEDNGLTLTHKNQMILIVFK